MALNFQQNSKKNNLKIFHYARSTIRQPEKNYITKNQYKKEGLKLIIIIILIYTFLKIIYAVL
jgi:hypothetical protein